MWAVRFPPNATQSMSTAFKVDVPAENRNALQEVTNISDEPAASIITVDQWGRKFLQ
jgi:hypothetical protein